MGFFFRITLLVAVVLAVFNYAFYTQSGKMPAREWLSSAARHLEQSRVGGAMSAEKVKVSKWVDAKGVTHYENRPVDGASTIEVDPNSNVLPPSPIIDMPDTKTERPKSMNEEVQELQKAKDTYYESVINN